MLQAMFAGVSGMQAHQTRMNTIGNNISNVNTVGFKAQRVSFEDQLSFNLRSAAPPSKDGNGGVNPAQLGLGVSVGAIDTLNLQGNLQSTGKGTDLAIQGNGFFMVSNNGAMEYTRDGSFDLDSNGVLVNPASGVKVLGYPADAYGKVDTTAPITSASEIQIPVGTRSDARQTSKVGALGNLDAAAALISTKVDNTGNLDSGAAAGTTVSTKTTVYDALGNPHDVVTTFSNPVSGSPLTGVGVPAGATRAWSVSIKADNTVVYDSAAGKSKMYWVGNKWQFANTTNGSLLGSTLQLNGGAASNQGQPVPGSQGAPNLNLNLNYGAVTNSATASAVTGTADGNTGTSPNWACSVQVYDSLGIGHLVTIKYNHTPVGANAPAGATGRWDWTAEENGVQVGNSSTAPNSPLYFGTDGQLVAGASQTLTLKPTNGATSPFSITMDSSALTQLARDSSAVIGSQDGTGVGTLQNFTISSDGLVTGVFTTGQTRVLGQLAMASFPNAGGMERVGGNRLRETPNSGLAQVGTPNAGGRGSISTGYLELSNVDLSTEFTNLIITQRGFQANTRIISVVDSLLQDVINLKQ